MMSQHTHDVRNAYNQIAGRYDALMTAPEIYRLELWKLYRESYHAGQHILDLGCGTGTDSLFLARMGCRVTALDISSNMLEQLRKKITGDESAAITILEADINALSKLALPEVDGVVSGFAVINTLDDIKSLVNSLYSLLAPKGKIILHGLNQIRSSDKDDKEPELATRIMKIGKMGVSHTLMTPAFLYNNYFTKGFSLTKISGHGRFYPFYENPHYPNWLKKGVFRIENLVFDDQTLLKKGRFFIIEMRKK